MQKKNLNNLLRKKKYTIILFHGVIKKKTTKIRNYTNKHILYSKYEKIIKFLKKNGNRLSLKDYIELKKKNSKIPDFSYSITFDDGFYNNYSIASPILKKYKIPTIFYVSTNLIKNNLMTWIDQIEYLLEKENFIIRNFLGEKKINLDSKVKKINFLKKLRKKIKKNPAKFDLSKIVKIIYKNSNKRVVYSSNHILDKKMTFNNIKSLNQTKFFEIGSHCHNHNSMSFLNKKELDFEINTSLDLLRRKLNKKIINFSYPEGMKHDFNTNVIYKLKKKKIIACPTAIYGFNDEKTDLFHLRRIMI